MALLKELREEKGITQIEMAFMLGMSYQNYRNYDCGKYKDMSKDLQDKISEILEIEYTYQSKS